MEKLNGYIVVIHLTSNIQLQTLTTPVLKNLTLTTIPALEHNRLSSGIKPARTVLQMAWEQRKRIGDWCLSGRSTSAP